MTAPVPPLTDAEISAGRARIVRMLAVAAAGAEGAGECEAGGLVDGAANIRAKVYERHDEVLAEVDRLVAALRAAREERDQAQAELAQFREMGEERFVQQLVEETAIKSMEIRSGKMDLDLSVAKYIGAAMVSAARVMLGDAPNYSETVAWDVKVAEQPDMYTLVVQRHAQGTLTPHQARQKAEKERDEARAAVAAAEQAAAAARQAIEQALPNLQCTRCPHPKRFHDGTLHCAGDILQCACKGFTHPALDGLWRALMPRDALAADVPAAADWREQTCRTCGHLGKHHEANECWWVVVADGRDKQCGCHWMDLAPAGSDAHYLATACYHGHHAVCGGAQHQRGDTSAPHCKFCEAVCSCPKHLDPLAPCVGSERKRRHHPTCATPEDDGHLGWCGPDMDAPAATVVACGPGDINDNPAQQETDSTAASEAGVDRG